LDQPGVNINEVNDNGDSILLSMMKEGSDNTLDENFVQQIEELVSFGYLKSEIGVHFKYQISHLDIYTEACNLM
jgi:hypothetical protein